MLAGLHRDEVLAMNYREIDELAAEIGFNSFECDSEIAEKVTINDVIKEKRINHEQQKNKM